MTTLAIFDQATELTTIRYVNSYHVVDVFHHDFILEGEQGLDKILTHMPDGLITMQVKSGSITLRDNSDVEDGIYISGEVGDTKVITEAAMFRKQDGLFYLQTIEA